MSAYVDREITSIRDLLLKIKDNPSKSHITVLLKD
jgi:hypothetical protein